MQSESQDVGVEHTINSIKNHIKKTPIIFFKICVDENIARENTVQFGQPQSQEKLHLECMMGNVFIINKTNK